MVMTDGMATPDDLEAIRRMTELIAEIETHAARHRFVDTSGNGESTDMGLIRTAIAKWRGTLKIVVSSGVIHSRSLAHGFLEVEQDHDDEDGLYIQAAAHKATGFAYLSTDEVTALRDALTKWLERLNRVPPLSSSPAMPT